MSLSLAKANDLIALTTSLAALTEQDIVTLKGKRPSALDLHDNERATLLLLFGKAAAEFKSGTALAPLPADVKLRLKTANERLHKALKEQNRILIRFRHITEGLVKAVVDNVAARAAPPAYAKSGAFAKPAAARATAMTFNQAI